MWKAFPLSVIKTLEEALEIIEDGLCYGYEFKVENHQVYYREIPMD